ncbi:hypothetical protein [Candidatus Anaplasma sp. TIGMIC]|uniref:hypothetical protein n=1 Tax=Candidatus Anaplasma sp. TIGMIC TaxID=3020713 RepID=UPI00232B0DD9|nr:hypothetical protein [Candidatus Anaplasma sp. TIGMIC]MDB1135117.1 hypothetical protein [Candidatus Anaplasma sp. TIGMIC]
MTPHELRNAIIENAVSLQMYYINSAFNAIHNTARVVSEERLEQVFDRVEGVLGQNSNVHVVRQYSYHTAEKALEALRVAIELYRHGASDLTVYDDINQIILDTEKHPREKHPYLLSIMVSTLQPVRKKFYSTNELESLVGRVSREALNSVTKICLPDSDSTDIENINQHLEEFFDSVPWVISTGELVEWVKILIGYANKVLNSPETREDVPTLAQCLSLLMTVGNIFRIKDNMSASIGTYTLETSAKYASNLFVVAAAKAEAAFYNHEQCYPGLAQKIQHLVNLSDEIERLGFYTGDSLLFFRGTQKYLVMLMHMFLSGARIDAAQEAESSGANSTYDPKVLLASMVDPFSCMQSADATASSLPATFKIYRMLHPTIPDSAALFNEEIPAVVTEFQDELRNILVTVHCLDSLMLRDFSALLEQHRGFSFDHDCFSCSQILDVNVSYYVMEYLKLAVGALQRHTSHSLRHEECAIYVSTGLLANVFAQGSEYKNLPVPERIYKDICRTQAYLSNHIPNTREDFLTYGHRLDQELMSCIFEMPINSIVGTRIANKRASFLNTTTENMQIPGVYANSYMGSSSSEQPAIVQPEAPINYTTSRSQSILGSAYPLQAASNTTAYSNPGQQTQALPTFETAFKIRSTGSEQRQWSATAAQEAQRTVLSRRASAMGSSHHSMGQPQQGTSSTGIYNEHISASTNQLGTENRALAIQRPTQHKTGYTAAGSQPTSVVTELGNTSGTTTHPHNRIGNSGKGASTTNAGLVTKDTSFGSSHWSVAIARLQREQDALRKILDSYTAEPSSASTTTESSNTASSTDSTVFSHYEGNQCGQEASSAPGGSASGNMSLSSSEWHAISRLQENATVRAILDNSTTDQQSSGATNTRRLSSGNVEAYLAQHGDSQCLFNDGSQGSGIIPASSETYNTAGSHTYTSADNTPQQQGTRRLTENEYGSGAITIKITEQQTKIGTFVETQGPLESNPTLNSVDAALEGGYKIVSSLESKKRYKRSTGHTTSTVPSSDPEVSFFAVPMALSHTRSSAPALVQRAASVHAESSYERDTESQKSLSRTVHFGIEENQLQRRRARRVQEPRQLSVYSPSYNVGTIPRGSSIREEQPSNRGNTTALRNMLGATASEFTISTPSTSYVSDTGTTSGPTTRRTTTAQKSCRGKATGAASRGRRKRAPASAAYCTTNLGNTKRSATSVTEPGYLGGQPKRPYFTEGSSSGVRRYDNATATYDIGGVDHGYHNEVPAKRGYSTTTQYASVMESTPPAFNTNPKPSSSGYGSVVTSRVSSAHSVSNILATHVQPSAVGTVIEPSSVTPMAYSRDFQGNIPGNN